MPVANNQHHNLSVKKLTDFTTEDTIYIRNRRDDRHPVYLCQFISYDKSKAMVKGKILDSGLESYEKRMVNTELNAKYTDCALFGNATDEDNRAYYRWFDGSLYAMHPLEKHKVVENDLHVAEHPSYAMARFSRISGGNRALFGSSIQSQQTITLCISRAEHNRSLNNDYFHARNEIIEVEMSANQFSELITSFNMGGGVPVTIRHINHERYPDPPFQSQKDLFTGEFKKQMHNFGVDMQKMIEQATDILENKANIGKGDREVISKSIDRLVSHITSSIPFVQKQFVESMESTVIEAKAEIEAFIEKSIRNKGLEALGYKKEENMPLLDNNDKNDI